MQPDNSAECLIQLLRQLQIPVSRRSVYEELGKHPDHPSLLAFSDVLHTWGVPNGAYQVSGEELAAVPTPFVAHLATQGGEFRLIEQVGAAHVTGAPLGKRPATFTAEEFNRAFTGSVLLAELRPAAGEPHYRQHRQEQAEALRWPLIAAGCLLLVALALLRPAFWQAADWHLALLLAAKSAGLVVAGLLLAQSLGHANPLLQRLCGSGPANGCNTILASPGGRLVLAGLTLLSLPFTFYSLYYQARVARQWCVLCCTVLAVLWVEFGASAAYLAQPLSLPAPAEWGALLGCLLAPVVGWVFVKPYLAQARQAATLREQLAALKRNQRLFASALAAQPRHELLPTTSVIQLGNPSARQVLTVVTSPTCPPCARTHEHLRQWLARRDDLQVQLVFAVPDDPKDLRTQVAAHLLALHQQYPATAQEALHHWYAAEQRDYVAWASRYPVAAEALAAAPLLQHHTWCRQVAIRSTPTILLNGQPLPALYQVEDIQYFW